MYLSAEWTSFVIWINSSDHSYSYIPVENHHMINYQAINYHFVPALNLPQTFEKEIWEIKIFRLVKGWILFSTHEQHLSQDDFLSFIKHLEMCIFKVSFHSLCASVEKQNPTMEWDINVAFSLTIHLQFWCWICLHTLEKSTDIEFIYHLIWWSGIPLM